MDIVKTRRYKNQYGVDQVSLAVPLEIERKMPKSEKMFVNYNEETGVLEYKPVIE